MEIRPNGSLRLHTFPIDIPQDQGFISFYNALSEKPATLVRFFDRGDFYTVHGQDALMVAKDVFKTFSIIKTLGSGTKKLESVALSKANFESFARELLLVRHYCIDIYVCNGGKGDWSVQHRASPGNLTQVEELIFGTSDLTTTTGIMSFTIGSEGVLGCCYVDVNERKISVSQFTENDSFSNLQSLIVQLSPKEVLLPAGDAYASVKSILKRYGLFVNEAKRSDFAAAEAVRDLNRLLRFRKGQQENAAALPQASLTNSMAALAALIKYLGLASDDSNLSKFSIVTFDLTQYVRLDSAASAALHLTAYGSESLVGTSARANAPRTLIGLLNKCRTSSGQRLLAQWIKQPLTDKARIEERLNIVETFVSDVNLRQSITEDHLRRVPDIQRLTKKLQNGRANLQDCFKFVSSSDCLFSDYPRIDCYFFKFHLIRIYQVLARLPTLLDCLSEHDGPHSAVLFAVFTEPLRLAEQKLAKLKGMIETTVDIALASQKGEFVIKSDFDEDLKELRSQMDEYESEMDKLLNRAARDLNLEPSKSVKLESNPQFGHYFRVTLKDEKMLRNNPGYSDSLLYLNDNLSQLDVLTSFAVCAINAPIAYCRPIILERGSGTIELTQVRHPCLELQDGVNFIANDAIFRKDGKRFYIITGPNMGGKSTYLRSVGLAVLMAQLGCFVSAESATISIVDAVLARVGAGDCHAKGISTFMAEMIETSNIIKTATKDSLVLIDELGRGTSTFDGFGLAWAIAEHIAKKINPCALFATHFHELTALEDEVPSVGNLHVTALTGDDTFTLLYRVQSGSCDQSFGLHVAELVHFPQSVLTAAKMKADELENLQPSGKMTGDAKRRRLDVEEGHQLMREFLKRAKEISQGEGESSEKMNELMRQVRNCGNPFIQCVLGVKS
nr:EOG090X02H9 [Leptodora kindtii]